MDKIKRLGFGYWVLTLSIIVNSVSYFVNKDWQTLFYALTTLWFLTLYTITNIHCENLRKEYHKVVQEQLESKNV